VLKILILLLSFPNMWFLRARAIAIARISYGNSVRLSVRLSVRHDPVPFEDRCCLV